MSPADQEIEELRARVAVACRVLGVLEITASTFGHASARIPGSDRVLIRARGPAESGVRYTTAAEVIEIDLGGRRIESVDDGYRAPLEVHIHTQIYLRRPDVNAVVHVHPAAAVLLSICRKPLLPIYGSYDPSSLELALRGVPTFERSILIQTADLGRELAAYMDSASVCLMRGHGITTVANSVEEAALLAIHSNTLATISYQAHLLGCAEPIPLEEQEAFRALMAAAEASSGAPKPGVVPPRASSLWRYYTKLAAESR